MKQTILDNDDGFLKNRYRVDSRIQSGSYGKVSLAHDTLNNCEVAIKVIKKSDPHFIEVAQHEIEILTRLNSSDKDDYDNENICKMLDSFEDERAFYIVLEYCKFGDLYDYLSAYDEISVEQFLEIAKGLANAIKFCHSKQIYHRDIKPENILVANNFKIKLADWGLATFDRFSNENEIGTDKYMAPECIFNKSEDNLNNYYDCVYADYWSYGITLLFIMFRKVPFKKCCKVTDSNFSNYMKNVSDDEIDFDLFYDIFPSISENGIETIVKPLLQFLPQRRDLDKCLKLLDENYCYGFTVEEPINEEELYLDESVGEIKEDYIYDQEEVELLDFIDEKKITISETSIPSTGTQDSSLGSSSKDSDDDDLFNDSTYYSMPPSLVDSTPGTPAVKINGGKKSNKKITWNYAVSWDELDDLDDDDDFAYEIISSMTRLSLGNSKNHGNSSKRLESVGTSKLREAWV